MAVSQRTGKINEDGTISLEQGVIKCSYLRSVKLSRMLLRKVKDKEVKSHIKDMMDEGVDYIIIYDDQCIKETLNAAHKDKHGQAPAEPVYATASSPIGSYLDSLFKD